MGAGGARARLRIETRASHAALDALPVALALARGEADRATYLRALQATASVFGRLEAAAREALPEGNAFAARWPARAPCLRADIAALGGAEWGVEAMPAACDSAPQALGWLYVLEGSLLGGQAIRRRLIETGRWWSLQPLSFHALPKDTAAARWGATLALLDAHVASARELACAAVAARDAFDAFIKAFARDGDAIDR